MRILIISPAHAEQGVIPCEFLGKFAPSRDTIAPSPGAFALTGRDYCPEPEVRTAMPRGALKS